MMSQREIPIREPTENRCADHVSYEKARAQETRLSAWRSDHSGAKKLRSNFRFERGQNMAIDVIEKINARSRRSSAVIARRWAALVPKVASTIADCSLPPADCKS